MSTTNPILEKLNKKTREVAMINSCASLLGWDERTYMPARGSEHRAEQLAYLAGLSHSRFVDPEIGDLLKQLKSGTNGGGPDSDIAVTVREIGRAYDRAVKMPQELVEEISRTTTLAQAKWAEARKNNDFASFKPWLEKVVNLKKQEAEAVGYQGEPYNALLDEFEPGATVAQIEGAFAKLRDETVRLLDELKGAARKPDPKILEREYPIDKQEAFGKEAAAAIGFDFDRGRLDITTHPFCTGIGPGDTRITTRYDAHHFPGAFFGILHEAGHGIYDQGLPAEHFGNPLGEFISLGIHESQSRMWENMVGRSRAFWSFFYPKAQQHFAKTLGDVSLDQFYGAINTVEPSFIRVEADEVTYNLHIMIRFELERAFFRGDLKVDDVPAAWNTTFEKYLGIRPPDDRRGCLQDVHWSAGLIGYFPTYSLGNLYAAQFFAKADADLGGLHAQFAKGQFLPLRDWLRKNIHQHGRRYLATDLVQRVTGKPLSSDALMAYMGKKFGEVYRG